jgi:hypothetical protein
MIWVTRENAKTDRVACPWLIKRFIDMGAEFIFVPKYQVQETAKRLKGISFDTAGADYTHRENHCTFEVLIKDYKLDDLALNRLALIVHGADIEEDIHASAESAGLLAIAKGFCQTTSNDQEKLKLQLPLYDALYAYCQKSPEHAT